MTKSGYTHVIMPVQLHDQLKTLATAQKISIQQLIAHMVSVKVDVNVSINTATMESINTTTPNQTSFLSEGSFGKESSLVLRPGFEPGSVAREATEPSFGKEASPRKPFVLVWCEVRADFLLYLKSIEYNERTVRKMVAQLDKWNPVIAKPMDLIELFSHVKRSRRHLSLGLRKLFTFYETLGFDKNYLDSLRAALPQLKCGIDLKIPAESKVIESCKNLSKAPVKYQALYNLLVDSGLRLIEGCELINKFQGAEAVKNFYRCDLAMFRGEKQAYYGHFTESTLKLIQQVKDKLKDQTASNYFKKNGYVAAKYLRKFVFDTMTDEKLNIPESVADFIEGRVPKTVGATHYMLLRRKAAQFYPRYAKYITELRRKALN